MSDWKAKRFWTEATVQAEENGWTVRLDGKPIRTPLKTPVHMPTRALADGAAAEWQAQDGVIDPLSMPLMRAVNATLDKVMPQQDEVAGHLAGYGESDLLCYRATAPARLAARQADAWDPMLDWAAGRYGARLRVTEGVMPVAQDDAALEGLRARVHGCSPWEITALSEFITLSGSLILGLAALEEEEIDRLWALSRIDEEWQAEQWGRDEEADVLAETKRAAFGQAARYLGLLRQGD